MSPMASSPAVNGYAPHTSSANVDERLLEEEVHLLNGEQHPPQGGAITHPESRTSLGTPKPHVLMHTRFASVIFDLGDVLFTWSASSPDSPLPPNTLKRVLRSSTWHEYEKGNLTQDQAYNQVAREFDISASDVSSALRAAGDSLKSNSVLLDVIREIKGTGRNIFAMSNISAPAWEVLTAKAQPSEWALFDNVFISATARERKPNLGFYQHVLKKTGIDPTRTIFVDDKVENVITARSFGMHGIVFDNLVDVVRQLKNLCGDPVQRAQSFLDANKKRLVSVTSTGLELRENFTQLLILDACGDSSLVNYVESPRLFNVFQGPGMLTTEQYPDDLDTTSFGLILSTHIDMETKHDIMNEMLHFRNQDGIVLVYFDHSRPRLDPIVCINVITLFYRNGRGRELDSNLEWLYLCLLNRAYTSGTLYYVPAEAFLFFLSRLMQSSSHVRERFMPVFKDRITERFGLEGDTLALAMRILAAANVGLVGRSDLEQLLSMQEEDGSWTNGWFWKYGSSDVRVRNDGYTTVLAIKAVEAVAKLDLDNGPEDLNCVS